MKKIVCINLWFLIFTCYIFLEQPIAISDTNQIVRSPEQHELTDIWVVYIEKDQNPDELAKEYGATCLGTVGPLSRYYKFRIPETKDLKKAEMTVKRIKADKSVKKFWQQTARWRFLRDQDINPFQDPLFTEQWHLVNTGQNRGTIGADIHVLPAWNEGFTGVGVVIAIVDDGLQYTHPDIELNYRSDLSYDFNDNDNDPYPSRYDTHGTPSAGIAAARDNGTCGVGVAFRAGLAGIRLIAKTCTDADEAEGLSFKRDEIHVYSNSWGPPDYGSNLEGPGPITQQALEDNIINGRNGLGSIYIWASGNGRERKDNVNYDGYANSRFTIAVGSVDQNGILASYSEGGAPLMIVAPSKATSYSSLGIVTTDLLGGQGESSTDCLKSFGGTSASAPMVAGVVALMLEANPNLSWRDVQHILIRTAFQNDPSDSEWKTNAAGHFISHKYGFGRVNAGAAVELAQQWNSVPNATCISYGPTIVKKSIPDNSPDGVESVITVSEKIRLEHVEVSLIAPHSCRGDLRIILISPSGTESILAEMHNDYNKDYNGWTFMTVRHWDELSNGDWYLRVIDERATYTGEFQSWQLKLYGTPYLETIQDAIQILQGITGNSPQNGLITKDINMDGKIGLEESIRMLQNITTIRDESQ